MAMEMAEGEPPYMEFPPLRVRVYFLLRLLCSLLSVTAQALFLITTKGIPPLKEAKRWSVQFRDFVQHSLEKEGENRPDSIEISRVLPFLRPSPRPCFSALCWKSLIGVQHPFLKTACEPREIGQMIGTSNLSIFRANRFAERARALKDAQLRAALS
jgi:serine/threonine protein kinase